MLHGNRERGTDVVLVVALLLFESSLVVLALALHKQGERPLALFLNTNAGRVLLAAVAGAMGSGVLILRQYLRSKRAGSRAFRLTVMMNLVMVVILGTTIEGAIRLLSYPVGEQETFMGRRLLPRRWEHTTRRYHQILAKGSVDLSYLVYDDLMGWTVGPARRSANGLYFSSVEGIRAPRPSISYATLRGKPRIALVGDSFTFGEEARYEETWGHFLERELESEFQILNFGVPGYGIDQACLRYERDVLPWKSEVVVFAFIAYDAVRSMTVYSFLAFPDWDFPFSKPRFAFAGGELSKLNVPTLTPQAIFSRGSIRDLPFLEYDSGYNDAEWQWKAYHHSYLARLLVSRFPKWPEPNPNVSPEALLSVNGALLQSFQQSALKAGALPLIVFFPVRENLSGSGGGLTAARRVLRQAGLEFTDMTGCVSDVAREERFVASGNHYSPQGNAAVAKCLARVVRERLGKRN